MVYSMWKYLPVKLKCTGCRWCLVYRYSVPHSGSTHPTVVSVISPHQKESRKLQEPAGLSFRVVQLLHQY